MWETFGFPAASTLIAAVVAMAEAIEKRSEAVRNETSAQTLVKERI
jgi:hypothetical protein